MAGPRNTARGGAVLSDCGRYRYSLERGISSALPNALFIGVNPSTADGLQDDPTIRKMMGFCRAHGWGRMEVVNLFAYRCTDIRHLAWASEPVGPENDETIFQAMQFAQVVIPCWGARGKLPGHLHYRIQEIHHQLGLLGPRTEVKCLGYTQSGDPRHPLMLAYSTPLVPYKPAPHQLHLET